MDPAGGPGPPRPAAESATNIAPAPPEGALQMFPFNATQHQPPLGLQISHAADSSTLPTVSPPSFDGAEAFVNNPFIASMPRRQDGEHVQTNVAQNVGSTAPLLQHDNSGAVASASMPMASGQQSEPAPSQTEQQRASRDIFGELEKALALGGSTGQNNAEESFDVLDDALGMPSQPVSSQAQPQTGVPQAVSSQQQPISLQPWQESQNSNASAQRTAQLQQSQLQSQLEQQRQHQQLQQRHLQQQAQMAQQHLRQQHLQRQRMHQEQWRQQQLLQQQQFQSQHQQASQMRQLQSEQQTKNTAQSIASQAQQLQQNSQSQAHPTLRQAPHSHSQHSQHSQHQQQSLLSGQQLHQTQAMSIQRQQLGHQFIQPRVTQPLHSTQGLPPGMTHLPGQGKVTYSAPSFPVAGAAGHVLNGAAADVGVSQPSVPPGSIVDVAAQSGETPAMQGANLKAKPGRKQSQRRPRSKVQQKVLQAKSIQAAASTQGLPQNQHIAQHMPVGQRFTPGLPQEIAPQQQLPAQSRQEAYAPLQHSAGQSLSHRAQALSQLSRSQHQELQSRIIQQQLQIQQHKAAQGQPPGTAARGHAIAQQGVFPQTGMAMAAAVQAAPKIAMGNAQQMNARGTQSTGYSSASQANHIVGKFDAAALQNLLSRTTDPKVQAVLRQQLEMMRGNSFGQRVSHSSSTGHPPIPVQSQGQTNVHMQGPNSQNPHSATQQVSTLARPTAASQAGALNQHIGLKQQVTRQQQTQQHHSHQQPKQRQRQLPNGQPQNAGQVFSRTAQYQQLSQEMLRVLNPHASQSMASLPQHVQHQIQAQIQARHIQAQLQSQARFANQRSTTTSTENSARQQSQNVTILPQRTVQQAEARKPKRSPRSSRQDLGSVQPNGAVPVAIAGRADLQRAPLSTSSTPTVAKSASHGHPVQTHIVQQSQAGKSARRRTAVRTQGKEGSQGSQSTTSRTSSARRAAESKMAAERKRAAREAELKEIAEQKRRRLSMGPTNDYLSVLAPDYRTPFASRVNAWQRLIPYHVLLSSDKDWPSIEVWGTEIDKLSKQYRKWLATIKRNAQILKDRELQSVYQDQDSMNLGMLSNEDCMVMEQVVLEDLYEAARQNAILAQREAAELGGRHTLGTSVFKSAEQKPMPREVIGAAAMSSEQRQNALLGIGSQHLSSSNGVHIGSSSPSATLASSSTELNPILGRTAGTAGSIANVNPRRNTSEHLALRNDAGVGNAMSAAVLGPSQSQSSAFAQYSRSVGMHRPSDSAATGDLANALPSVDRAIASRVESARVKASSSAGNSNLGHMNPRHLQGQPREAETTGAVQGQPPVMTNFALQNQPLDQRGPPRAIRHTGISGPIASGGETVGDARPISAGYPPNFVANMPRHGHGQWMAGVLRDDASTSGRAASPLDTTLACEAAGQSTAIELRESEDASRVARRRGNEVLNSMARPGQSSTVGAIMKVPPVSSSGEVMGTFQVNTVTQTHVKPSEGLPQPMHHGDRSASTADAMEQSHTPQNGNAHRIEQGQQGKRGIDERSAGNVQGRAGIGTSRSSPAGSASQLGESPGKQVDTERRSMGMGSLLNSEGS